MRSASPTGCAISRYSLCAKGTRKRPLRFASRAWRLPAKTKDKFAHARTLQNAACVALARGDMRALRSLYEDLLAVAPKIPYPLWVSEHLSADLKTFAGYLLRERGDDPPARAHFEGAVTPILW
jgi:hypothetical protein